MFPFSDLSLVLTFCGFLILEMQNQKFEHIHTFFYKHHFYKQHQAKTGKKLNAKQHPEADCYLKVNHILHPHYHPKIIGHTLKNTQKNKRVCVHGIILLITMKTKTKMKNRSHRYDISRPRSKQETITINIKCLSMVMLICIK